MGSAEAIMAEMFGRSTGCSRGRGGSMHLFDTATRFYGGNAIVAGGLPLAVGLALADRMRGAGRVPVVVWRTSRACSAARRRLSPTKPRKRAA